MKCVLINGFETVRVPGSGHSSGWARGRDNYFGISAIGLRGSMN